MRSGLGHPRVGLGLAGLLAITCATGVAVAQSAGIGGPGRSGNLRPVDPEAVPLELVGVGIEQKLDGQIPLDLTFRDSNGRPVQLSELFRPGRPVILTLNYFRCPMLCQQTINGLVAALNDIDWSAGAEFDIVTVSFDPREGPDVAEVSKRVQLSEYRRDTAAEGWHFLTGQPPEITALTEAVGFGYRFDERSGEFAHSSTIIFVTPEGRISRYMDDVLFQPKDVRLALVEASEGAIGSPMEKFLLFTCYRYDPDANSYTMSAIRVMRLAGFVTLVGLGAGIIILLRRGSKHGADPLALGGLET